MVTYSQYIWQGGKALRYSPYIWQGGKALRYSPYIWQGGKALCCTRQDSTVARRLNGYKQGVQELDRHERVLRS